MYSLERKLCHNKTFWTFSINFQSFLRHNNCGATFFFRSGIRPCVTLCAQSIDCTRKKNWDQEQVKNQAVRINGEWLVQVQQGLITFGSEQGFSAVFKSAQHTWIRHAFVVNNALCLWRTKKNYSMPRNDACKHQQEKKRSQARISHDIKRKRRSRDARRRHKQSRKKTSWRR